jgi:hypothetical protein
MFYSVIHHLHLSSIELVDWFAIAAGSDQKQVHQYFPLKRVVKCMLAEQDEASH